MPADLDMQQLTFLVILVLAFALLLTERLRNDIVALLIILALALTGVLSADEALAGLSSEPAVIVVAVFVLSAALENTGASESIGRWIGRLSGSTYARAIAVIMPTVALLSAFTHHLTTTAFMMPIILRFSRERGIAPSKMLMPLSFAASLGTTITIIGAPAFLIASATLQSVGLPGLGIFSIAPIGLTLTALGTVFVLLAGRFLLPSRPSGSDIIAQLRLDRYFTEVTILPNSPLLGKSLEEIKALHHYDFTVAGFIRSGQRLSGPFGQQRLQANDVLLVHTTPEDLASFRRDNSIELHPIEKFLKNPETPGQQDDTSLGQLVQAIVAPRSEMIGRSLRDIDFRRRYGALVIAFWRRGSFVQQELARIKLRAGDVLVLQGDDDAFARVRKESAFLMFVPFNVEAHSRRRAPVAVGIMLASIVLATLNIFPLQIVMLLAAVAVVLTGCLSPAQAYRAIDTRIYVFIAGAIPLGTAMEQTGVSNLIAQWLGQVVGDWSPVLVLLAIFAVAGLVTQFMSDAATTALFAPLVLALARSFGHSPEAYVVTVAMASVAAFLTPIGHHGNLLIYEPGGYQFKDFVTVGTPLTILVALVVVFVSMMLWPLT